MNISADVFGRVITTVFCLLITFGTAQTAPTQDSLTPADAHPADAQTLTDKVTPQGIRAHMAALQRVADTHGGNRAAGTPGYAASVRYAEQTLRAAGYTVRRQPFTVTLTKTLAETAHTTGKGVGEASFDPNVMAGSPNTAVGGLTAALALPEDPLGCTAETERRAGIQNKLRGAVVLIKRGSCTFAQKSRNAAAAGAVAALIYNDEQDGPLFGSLGDAPEPDVVPTAGLTQKTGKQLVERLKRETVRVRLELRVSRMTRRTANVIAELPGTAQSVVMVGAHLDSVPEGPGINDNGSGVGLVLELARGLAQEQGVRFALWGAEELGLLGSEHYIGSLSPAELKTIRAYLNFDMLSSPNAAPFAYGDPALTELFTETFAAQGLTLLPDAVGGRSDHAPFEAAGVPVAGLFSGAEGLKPEGEVNRYGGDAAPYDACYHRACDTLKSSSTPTATRYLDLMAGAAAAALEHLLSQQTTE